MIGPHQGELHAIAILGAEEALLQGLLHVPDAAVPVPVEQKDVDPVVGRKVDLASRPFWIALVEVAPRGLERLVVAVDLVHQRTGAGAETVGRIVAVLSPNPNAAA